MNSFYWIMNTPIGKLALIEQDQKLIQIDILAVEDDNFHLSDASLKKTSVLAQAEKELKEYFAGKRQAFTIPIHTKGTAFQENAWKALTRIPFGKTWSYQQQAKNLGSAQKARAVGQANGRNPLPIVIPCHRVIAKDGSLGGYSGGLNIKEQLLALEQKFA